MEVSPGSVVINLLVDRQLEKLIVNQLKRARLINIYIYIEGIGEVSLQ